MWRWIGDLSQVQPIAGIEARDFTDAEFEAVCTEYDKGFDKAQAGSLKRCGLWEHNADKKVKED